MKKGTKTYIRWLILLLMMTMTTGAQAKDYRYAMRFYFHLNKYDIDESLNGNYATVDSILYRLRDLRKAGAQDIKLHITSYASLEASDAYNFTLAGNRTNSLKNFLQKFVLLNGIEIVTEPNIFDWETLVTMTRNSNCPYKDEALRIMTTVAESNLSGDNNRKMALQNLGGGVTYKYMSDNFFPHMRNSALTLTATVADDEPAPAPAPVTVVEEKVVYQEPAPKEREKIHVALSTNGLYDLAAIPNIGADVWLGNKVSIGANWMYAWWKRDKSSWYHRVYGGDAHITYWLSDEERWRGHHIGAYGQMLTFDVEWGHRGYQGQKYFYGGGLSYGYTMNLAKRLGLDFGLSLGYLHGTIYEYTPSNIVDKYLYDKTRKVNWIGPTSLNVSLIWDFDL